MRTLTALIALLTLTACGPGEEVEQRDPRCDYEDDREWTLLKASESETGCRGSYLPDECSGAGCPVRCGGFYPDERQTVGGLVDVLVAPNMTIFVECVDENDEVDRFACKESAVVLVGPEGCATSSYFVPTAPWDQSVYRTPGRYSAVWKVPAE